MARKVQHSLLHKAKKNKNDEFYTQLIDIESELQYYEEHFRGKVVYCNCDDPFESNFFRYFVLNFNRLGLKSLITTSYKSSLVANTQVGLFSDDETLRPEKGRPKIVASKFVINSVGDISEHGFNLQDIAERLKSNKQNEWKPLKGDGDFRSEECVELLKQSDIVVTNPPFSLFREFVSQLVKYEKNFLIIGNINAITYKEIFNLIKEDMAWLGVNLGRGISGFIVPEHYELYGTEVKIDELGNRVVSPNNCLWLTNLDNSIRHEDIILNKKYDGNEYEYPKYDNYNGININRTQDIPLDYKGYMGVPITFLHKYNPEQFEIIKFRKGDDEKDLSINGKCPYFRILIRNKRLLNTNKNHITLRDVESGEELNSDTAQFSTKRLGNEMQLRIEEL